MMVLLQVFAMACWAVCGFALAFYVVLACSKITYVTLPDGRRSEHRLPISFRILLPLVSNMQPWISRPYFNSTRVTVSRLLREAGLEEVLSSTEFMALKFLEPIAFALFTGLILVPITQLLPDSFLTQNVIMLVLFAALFGWIHPLAWLRRARSVRHRSIQRALPFVLDLLTLSVDAGMDFMGALQRNCMSGKVDPLNEEIQRMTHEIRLGKPRRKALSAMAERVGLSDLTSFVHALVQADELGVSIGTILRIQSEQIRSRRFERAEKLANEAPVKMLGPLLLFIFPAVFVILLAPILVQASKMLS